MSAYTEQVPEGGVVLEEHRNHWAVVEGDATVFYFGSAPDLHIAVPTERLRELLATRVER